jgi:hypothetical protein
MIDTNGSVFYQDDYGQLYRTTWEVKSDRISITSAVFQPYIWGKESEVIRRNNNIYKEGIVTVTEQILQPVEYGYIIIAEGTTQYEDYIQLTFNCEMGPRDDFKYHLHNLCTDQVISAITSGPRWADPDDPNDVNCIWADVNNDGSPVDITATGGVDILSWIDVW